MARSAPALRYAIYALLGGAAALFAFPLIWLVLTALKPAEQTLAEPPIWLPVAHTVERDGVEVDVVIEERLAAPALWLVPTTPGQGEARLVALDSPAALDPARPVARRAEIGWLVVRDRIGEHPPRRDVVPPEAVTTRLRPRWENFPAALRAMGGRPVRALDESDAAAPRTFDSATDANFGTYLRNTLLVCVLGVAGTVLSNALVAYGFARLRWRGRDAFFAITLATLMVPFPVLMVPLYGVFKELGWVGTLLPLWVPSWFGSAFNIFLMRQFFRTIPEELSEAARLDGASEWRIFWRIILPLSRPVLAVAALFHFLHAWNDFLGPLLYLSRKPTFTLALALQEFQSQHGGVQWHELMAASLVTILPVVILFFFAQKTFVRGIATTGGKS